MDYDMLCEKAQEGAYKSKLPYPGVDTTEKLSDEECQKMKKAYRKDDGRLYNEFRDDCRAYIEYELGKKINDEQFAAVFTRAWDDGHSAGYLEVVFNLEGLMDIVKAFVKKKG
jgi:hypothetical protein